MGTVTLKTAEERFWAKVDTGGPGGCWLWTASRGKGYGQLRAGGGLVRAHRFAYELLVGPIPDGLDLDHLCRVRHCVNPAHLDPVSRQENLRRSPLTLPSLNASKTHCLNGHPFNLENTRTSRGDRACRACDRLRRARRKAANVNALIP